MARLPDTPSLLSRREQLAELAALVEQAGPPPATEDACFSCGCPPLDHVLPGGGLSRGSVVEWLADGAGCGASLLAIAAAREAQRSLWAGGAVVVIDRQAGFYPPAALAWGLDLGSTIIVHPRSEADERWAIDQALRCRHAAAVLAWPRRIDGRTFRRFQLAAEASGTVGLLVRSGALRGEPSWAHLRLGVAPVPVPLSRAAPLPSAQPAHWRLAVSVLRARQGALGPSRTGSVQIVVQIDPASGEIHEASSGDLAPQLARPTARAAKA
ncbi:MAG TPA: hypothetical protein VEQ85_14520 [Lacipirellulaceae bacterium]|nr:hypothetical protein [Lacipirellulaceae bacterium]